MQGLSFEGEDLALRSQTLLIGLFADRIGKASNFFREKQFCCLHIVPQFFESAILASPNLDSEK